MLKRAHDEKAWQALGYTTWNDYVKAEIKLCKSRVFQLLDHAEIKGELEKSNMLDSATLPTSSRVTDELKAVPPEQRHTVYAAAVEAADGKRPTAKQVQNAALSKEEKVKLQKERETRETKKRGKELAMAFELANEDQRRRVIEHAIDLRPKFSEWIKTKAVVEQQEGRPIKQAEAKVIEGEVVEEMSDAEWEAMKVTNPAFIKAREILAMLDQFPIGDDWALNALGDIDTRIREITKACWDANSASAKAAKEASL
jgi:hypothetical protein